MSFANRRVVVTGGTGAIGRVIVKAFLDRGAHVSSSYILASELESLDRQMVDHDRFSCRRVELTNEVSIHDWFAAMDGVDIVVNLAGGFAMGNIADLSLADWQRMQEMNLTTAFLSCREALLRMDPQSHGRLINVASFAATQQPGGMGSYTVAKAGVIDLTRVLAEETLSSKITANAILPTIMDTPANRRAMPEANVSSWVPAENVAHTVLFLADPKSWHITGAAIPLRGHC